MMAQVPFNQEDAVKLNSPMIDLMNDENNLTINLSNFKKLGLLKTLFAPEKNILEIGCGRGYFLEELYKKGGGNYFGLEPIPSEHALAIKKIALLKSLPSKALSLREIKKRIVNNTIEKVKFKNAFFDVITSYHVFEHLENPLVLLDRAKQWLKKDGKLIITCPNVEGAIPKRDLDNWRCNLSSHRWLPGKRTLTSLVEKNGFEIVKIFTYGGYPMPRTFFQSWLNYSFSLLGKGDVVTLHAVKN